MRYRERKNLVKDLQQMATNAELFNGAENEITGKRKSFSCRNSRFFTNQIRCRIQQARLHD